MKLSAMSTVKKFLVVDDGLDLKINKRGMAPEGGGEVHFRCPNRKQLRPLVVGIYCVMFKITVKILLIVKLSKLL